MTMTTTKRLINAGLAVRVALILTSVVHVEGFHLSPQSRSVPRGVISPSFSRLSSTPTDDDSIATATDDASTDIAIEAAVVATVTTAPLAAAAAATVVAATTSSPTTEGRTSAAAAMMDERIYNFNKIVIDSVYDVICFIYPVTGGPRDFARFYVLETVARVPYFAYLSVMHLRETFGERGLGEKMRTHYAEADNELHHLLIMEELGGNSNPLDRALAQAMAFGYYWYVVAVYAWSQECAYHLSELIEDHAYNTYNTYLTNHEEMLKGMPVPKIATKYYVEDNPFLFDLFCTVKDYDETGTFSTRRPQLQSLYDVFVNVRDDEKEHWKTLCNLVQYGDMQGVANANVKATEPAAM